MYKLILNMNTCTDCSIVYPTIILKTFPATIKKDKLQIQIDSIPVDEKVDENCTITDLSIVRGLIDSQIHPINSTGFSFNANGSITVYL